MFFDRNVTTLVVSNFKKTRVFGKIVCINDPAMNKESKLIRDQDGGNASSVSAVGILVSIIF